MNRKLINLKIEELNRYKDFVHKSELAHFSSTDLTDKEGFERQIVFFKSKVKATQAELYNMCQSIVKFYKEDKQKGRSISRNTEKIIEALQLEIPNSNSFHDEIETSINGEIVHFKKVIA